MKKFLIASLLCLTFSTTISLSGCEFLFGSQETDIDDVPFVEVSTAQELQEGGTNIILQNDIDFGGEIFDPICVNIFDGNGYTISNAIIASTTLKDAASFFAEVYNMVQNVTFENITISAENTSFAAVVLALPSSRRGYGDESENIEHIKFNNVHIQGCTITLDQNSYEDTITYVGGILGSGTEAKLNASDYSAIHNQRINESIINCSVKDTIITVEGCDPEREGSYVYGPDIYVGGICGSGFELAECIAENNTISVASNQRYSEPYVGGIVGSLNEEGTISNCSAYANYIDVVAGYYRYISLINTYECSDVYLGGIFGTSGTDSSVSYCNAEENLLTARSVGGYYIGGIGGSISANVTQSRVVNNVFEGTGYLDGEDKSGDPWMRNIGGISAYSAAITFSSTFSFGNQMTTTLSLDGVTTTDPTGSAVGFAKTTPSAIFMYCATGANIMTAGTTDEFATAALENIDSCYITSDIYGNTRNLPTISESDWYAEDQISMLLNLAGDNWTFTPGALPDLQ